MTKYLASISFNYPGTSHALSGCWNDSIMAKQTLAKYGFKPENIFFLQDKTDKPDHTEVINFITTVVKKLKRGDILFFHYSGHGRFTYDFSGDEKDHRDETLCPPKGHDISDDRLYHLLVRMRPAGTTVIGLPDCCHSGTNSDLPYVYDRRISLHSADKVYECRDKPTIWISGCRDKQTSADAYIANKYRGAMSWSAFTTFNKILSKRTDLNWIEMIGVMRYKLRKRFSQVPVLSANSVKIMYQSVFKTLGMK